MTERGEYVSPTKGILLGFEVETGKPVYLPFHHFAFTGMTGKAGKTTAIEAMATRSDYRTISFITKRGEKAFVNAKQIPLFFKERSDWQYVESLIEAELREDQRFNRSWIIKICQGTKFLRDVWNNVKKALTKVRKDSLSERVYTCLNAYFELIIPELEKYEFSSSLQIGKQPGNYVMNLVGMSLMTQAVIIRSVFEEIYEKEQKIIPTLPEAWKFIGARHTPVTEIAIRIIKEGYAVNIFLSIDSQDIASINPRIRGQIDNWILGRQRYEHEIERTLKAIPIKNKPTKEQIKTLKLGHFYVACEDWCKHVYAWALGVPEDVARKVALGELKPEFVRDKYLKPSQSLGDEDLIYKPKYEEEKKLREKADQEMKRLTKRNKTQAKIIQQMHQKLKDWERLQALLIEPIISNVEEIAEEVVQKNLPRLVKEALSQLPQTSLVPSTLELEHKELVVTISHVEKPVKMTTDDQQGKIMFVAVNELPKGFTVTQIYNALSEHGWNIPQRSLRTQVSQHLVKLGLLIRIPKTNPAEYRVPQKLKINVEKT